MKRAVNPPFWSITLTLMVGLFFAVGISGVHGQNTSRHWLQDANSHYDQKRWPQALALYQNYLSVNPGDVPVRLRVVEILYLLGHQQELLLESKALIQNEKIPPPDAYFFAARASHQLGQFAEAEKYYRQYLDTGSEKVDLELLSYYLRQIGSAHHGGEAGTRYHIENMGKSINTSEDEFGPVYSPNIIERFYYSRKVSGEDGPVQSPQSSMLFAEIEQGIWVRGGSLDRDLESEEEPFLLDFSKDGQSVFYTNPSKSSRRMTFRKSTDPEEDNQPKLWTHPYFDSSKGDRDLFTINDSAYLFSSNRWEGYGGYDIYVTFRRLGQWVVQNLGPVINSPYDEITPFLSTNGREIYFSSNSTQSIGGYDIFTAVYNDERESWASPQNMLQPVNSGMDDVGIRLSPDGSRALFASNRPSGLGGMDIYELYFEKERTSQQQFSQPRSFHMVKEYHSFSEKRGGNEVQSEKPVYLLPNIYYGDRPLIITPGIKADLDQLLRYSQLFPHTNLVVHIFNDAELKDGFTLYRPFMLLKNVFDYLADQGMVDSRILIRMYGGQYPLQPEKDSIVKRQSGPSQNRRLEFSFINTDHLPVEFRNEVMENMTMNSSVVYNRWKQRTGDLYFRIRLKDSDQLLKGFLFQGEKDVMLEMNASGKNYTYFAGIFDTMDEARQKLNEYKKKGFEEAEISAYLQEKEIKGNQITAGMIEKYPELKLYIIYQN